MENRDAERPPPTGGGAQLAPLFKICVFLRPTGRCAGGESGRLRQTPIGGLLNDRAEGRPLEHTRENEARCDQSADQQKFSFEGHVGAFDDSQFLVPFVKNLLPSSIFPRLPGATMTCPVR